MRATSEADIFVFFCTDLIGTEMWHSVFTLETGSSGRASRLTHKPTHRSIRSSSAGGVQSHLIDLQSSAADRWLQAVIKREDMDLRPQYTARAERKQGRHHRHSWNPSCHIFELTVSGFTVSTGTYTHPPVLQMHSLSVTQSVLCLNTGNSCMRLHVQFQEVEGMPSTS